jgi:hypothetical protein
MIKIDTEGFEYFVLKGLSEVFKNNKTRPAILCEVTPRANAMMDVTMNDLAGYMSSFGYQAYSLFNTRTKLDIAGLHDQTDVLFLAG